MLRLGQPAANGACSERKRPGTMRRSALSAPPDGGGNKPGDRTRAPDANDTAPFNANKPAPGRPM